MAIAELPSVEMLLLSRAWLLRGHAQRVLLEVDRRTAPLVPALERAHAALLDALWSELSPRTRLQRPRGASVTQYLAARAADEARAAENPQLPRRAPSPASTQVAARAAWVQVVDEICRGLLEGGHDPASLAKLFGPLRYAERAAARERRAAAMH